MTYNSYYVKSLRPRTPQRDFLIKKQEHPFGFKMSKINRKFISRWR